MDIPIVDTRAVIYSRVSLDRDRDKVTIENQVKACLRRCADKELEVVQIFEERNLSAFKKDVVRPYYEELKVGIQEGKYGTVIAYRLDRLTRSVSEALKLTELCKSHKVELVMVMGDVDTTSVTGQAFFTMSAIFAELEAATTGERVAAAEAASAKAGKPPSGGHRCYGFQRKGEGGQVIEAEAVHIRAAAKDIMDGVSLRQTTRRLNEAGSRTTTGREWVPRTLVNLLKNPRLRGMRSHLGVLYEAQGWTGIFSEDEHTRLVLKLTHAQGYKESPDRVKNKHLLTGLAICGQCGSGLGYGKFTSKNGNVFHRYACKKVPGTSACGGVSASEPTLNAYVIGSVREFGDQYVEIVRPRRLTLEDETATKEAEATRTQNKLDDLDRLYYDPDGHMTQEMWSSLRVPLVDRLNELVAVLARLQPQLDQLPDSVTVAPEFQRGRLSQMKGTVEEQRAFLRKFLSQVEVMPAAHRGGNVFQTSRVVLHWVGGEITRDEDLAALAWGEDSQWDVGDAFE